MSTDTVDLPAVGKVKTNTLIGIGVAGAVVIGYLYVRSARNASVDVAEDPNAGNSAGTFGADIGSGSGGYYATPSAASDTDLDESSIKPIVTNQDWFERATEILSDAGRDMATVQNTLGKYLDGSSTLTAEEKTIVATAKAAAGNEPKTAPVPAVVSTPPAPSVIKLIAPKTVGRETIGLSNITIKWSPVPGAVGYEIDSRNPLGQGKIRTSGPDLVETYSGMKSGTTYRFKVRAVDAKKVKGPWSAVYAFTTLKPAPKPVTVKR